MELLDWDNDFLVRSSLCVDWFIFLRRGHEEEYDVTMYLSVCHLIL